MKFADRVKQTTTATNAATISLSGSVASFRTFAVAFAAGDTGIPVCIDDGKGAWENGTYTLTNGATLTRTSIDSSSNNGNAVAFSAGVKEVFCTPTAKALAPLALLDDAIGVNDLPATTSIGANDYVAVNKPGTGDFKMKFADLVAAIGGNPPASDTTAPTVSSAQVANASPSVIAITFNEALAASLAPASAFTASGKTVSSVSISGAVVSITVSSAYVAGATITVGYTQPGANPRLQDAAGNAVATFSGRTVTNNVGSTATAPAAPTIGTAVAGDGYVDVAFTRNSNGGSVVLDSTVTLSTGQAATGTSSPIRVSAPNNVAVTATVRDRNAIGPSPVSAASNSVTPQGVPSTAYTITGYNGNAVKSTIDASASPVYGGLKQISAPNQGTGGGNAIYWNVNATSGGAQAPSARSGWSQSATVPPAVIADGDNTNGSSSINGLRTMGKAAAFGNDCNLWVANGSGTTTWYFWIKPSDGAAQMIGSATVTGA